MENRQKDFKGLLARAEVTMPILTVTPSGK
jgi:hypothetical protein